MGVTQSCHGHRFGSIKGKSRLIREDENDRSDEDVDEEEESRVRTFGKKNEPAKQMQVCASLSVPCSLRSLFPTVHVCDTIVWRHVFH